MDLSSYWWDAMEIKQVLRSSTVFYSWCCDVVQERDGFPVSFRSLLIVSVLGNKRSPDKIIIRVLSNHVRVRP